MEFLDSEALVRVDRVPRACTSNDNEEQAQESAGLDISDGSARHRPPEYASTLLPMLESSRKVNLALSTTSVHASSGDPGDPGESVPSKNYAGSKGVDKDVASVQQDKGATFRPLLVARSDAEMRDAFRESGPSLHRAIRSTNAEGFNRQAGCDVTRCSSDKNLQIVSDASDGNGIHSSDTISPELCTPRKYTPPPHPILDCNSPPPFYPTKVPYQIMAKASSSLASPSEDSVLGDHLKSRSDPLRTSRRSKRKRHNRSRSRSRSPLHCYSVGRAVELFGPTVTMYSVCGPPGGFRIGVGKLQCYPEDKGRATYSIQLDVEMAQRIAEETQIARDELLGTTPRSVPVSNPRAAKRRHVQSELTVRDKNDGMSVPEPNSPVTQSRSGRTLKPSLRKLLVVDSECPLAPTRSKHRKASSTLTCDSEPTNHFKPNETCSNNCSSQETTSSQLTEALSH